ncbi:DNHD1 [Symbiodinium sp. CCMP2456]|nr:DNHD1 [Symbiodinium sp. CCMP2456]
MPSSSPPKAAAGAAGLLDSTMPSNPGATMGSTKVIRLPQLQPSAEQLLPRYSTLRLAKLQPSAKLKTWDSRRATGSALSAVPMLPAAPMSARVERSQVPTISQLSTQYIQSSRSPQTSRSLSRSVRLFDSEIFNLDHEELSSYCLRGREANQPGAQLPSSGPQSGTAALQDEEADQRQVETVPAHLVQIRAMYSPTKTQPSEVEGAEDGGDSPALGASATSPTGAELGVVTTTAEEMLQAQVPDEEWDEETMLRRELAKLRTGEDVIAFFAKNGSNSSVKFVYCKRRENVDVTEFRPYDLEVISELMDGSSSATTAAKLGEHFTISATGVVHVSPGQQSEHMSLGDWMHQCLMYSVLTSMNFFKYYIHGKVFSRWQQHTRFTLYCHARKNLVRRLFLAKPLFVGPLIKICSLMREVESVKVVNIGSNVYNLADFDREQATVRSASCAQKELEMLHDQTVAAMDKLVQVVGQATEPQSHEPPQGTMRSQRQSSSFVTESAMLAVALRWSEMVPS